MTDRQLLQQALDAMRDAAYDEEGYTINADLAEAHDALEARLAHCDRCGKKLGGEGHIHTCTPLEQKRFEQWWDAGDDISNDAPYTPDTPIQFAWAGWQAALAQPKQEGDIHTCRPDPIGDAQDRLIAELAAQPEQEPVEWLTGCPECGMDGGCDCDSGTCTPPAAPMTEFEEAVAAVDNTLHHAIDYWQDRALKAEALLAQPEQEPVATVQCIKGITIDPVTGNVGIGTPAQLAPVQDSTCNKTLRAEGKGYPRTCMKCGKGPCIADRVQPEQEPVAWMHTMIDNVVIGHRPADLNRHPERWKPLTAPPAAQRQWVGLTDEEWQDLSDRYGMILFGRFKNEIEDKLKEKNT
jgi:hypothetical protein